MLRDQMGNNENLKNINKMIKIVNNYVYIKLLKYIQRFKFN